MCKLSHVNGLFRLIPRNNEPLEDMVIASLQSEVEIKNVLCNTVRKLPVMLEDIKSKVLEDKFITEMKKKLKDRTKLDSGVYSMCNDILMYSERLVVPLALQKRILKEFHGISRMKSWMRSYVYWCSMDRDIECLVKSCKSCALAVKAPPIKFNPWPELTTQGHIFMLTLLVHLIGHII